LSDPGLESDWRLEALLSAPVLRGPEVSPDGRWVAWGWSNVAPAADVFVARTDDSTAPLRLTETADDTRVVSWTPDSRAVVVGQDSAGDERERLFRVNAAKPGVMEPLTEESPNYYVRGGQVHPNGRWLVYGANFDAEAGEEIEATWLYRHDLRTGERRVLAKPERGNFYRPLLGPAGDTVLYFRNDLDPAGRQAWLVNVEGREDREILNFGPRAKVSARWFPDGRRILFTVEEEDATYRRLGVCEVRDGSTRWLLDDARRDPEYAFVPPNGGPVVVVEVREARVRATLLDVEGGAEECLPRLSGDFVPLSPTEDRCWIGLLHGARQPTDLVSVDPRGEEEPESITGLWGRTSLRPEDLAPAEDFRWRSVDGLEVQGWLYRARGRSAGTVVVIHGGPTSRSEDRFDARIQYLVSRGFNVLAPNYRGSTGFGLAFQDAIKEDGWGGREQEDIRTGIEALIRAGVAEPGRVGVTGTSYGGYSAWCMITRYPTGLVAAAAPICGMTDLVVDYNATRPDLRPYSEEMMGGTPEEIPARYRERSPVNFVENVRGRLLIVQGLKDPNVTPDNVRAVTRELDRLGKPYELLTFEDEGHGITRPENLRVLYPRLADFFAEAFS
jgi:dipeptidyl aminopeptidase/acylaminoacyl peptidase